MITIRKVASEADVSVATVSRVLNRGEGVSDDVRQHVLEVAGRLGYSGGRKAATNIIALTYTGRWSLASPYDVAILEGMAVAADEKGFDFMAVRLQSDRRPGESAAQALQRKGVRAAVVRTHADTRHICRELADEDFPAIVVGDSFGKEPVSYICTESKSTSKQAVGHLLSLGHRRIAIAVSHILDHDHADRMSGYVDALKEYDIEVDPKLVHRVWAMRPNGAQVMRNLMSLPDRPTAIFVTDPLVAIGAICQAHKMGIKIPDDLSIIGFDDADSRENIYPLLSAICQDAKQLGYEAVSELARHLSGENSWPVRKTLPTWLELHDTTGRPPENPSRVLPDGSRMASVPAV